MAECLSHPLIKPETIEERVYQLSLASTAIKNHTLIVLPTGLGKTIIAAIVIANRLQTTDDRALMLAPTKPLAEQHATFMRNVLTLEPEEVELFTGEVAPAKRKELWGKSRLVVSTPQVIENDLLARRISLDKVVHVTFDEAHRAVGNYSYVYIAEKYRQQALSPLVLGITASPGSDPGHIQEICGNLGIEAVEIRTEYHPDVAPYVHRKDIQWIRVDVPDEIRQIRELMQKVLIGRLDRLRELGFLPATARKKQAAISKRELLDLQKRIRGELMSRQHPNLYQAASLQAEAFKIKHGIDLVETQGANALRRYFERLRNEARSKGGSKASKRLVKDRDMIKAMHALEDYEGEHPKVGKVNEIITGQLDANSGSRIIVFTNFRDTASMLVESLQNVPGVEPLKFVGQASRYKDQGLTQKQQSEVLDKFKNGKCNVLVSTSVAEEGLDIPSTDMVLFYEPVPSEIRSIQRRGRTARKRPGKVVVLIARDTPDEAYYWVSKRKEADMQRQMTAMQRSGTISAREEFHIGVDKMKSLSEGTQDASAQRKIEQFKDEKEDAGVKIFVDQRETRSMVVRSLEKLGAIITVKTLETGDYVLSDRVCVERKTVDDFLSSLISAGGGSLFDQVSELNRAYDRPLLILEGEGLYVKRRIHPNAIRGALASIVVDFGVPILEVKDEDETAAMMWAIARREQEDKEREIFLHAGKTSMTLAEQQEYLVSSIADIGPVLARALLEHFGSVENVVDASEEELREVHGIGPVTATRIREVLSSPYLV